MEVHKCSIDVEFYYNSYDRSLIHPLLDSDDDFCFEGSCDFISLSRMCILPFIDHQYVHHDYVYKLKDRDRTDVFRLYFCDLMIEIDIHCHVHPHVTRYIDSTKVNNENWVLDHISINGLDLYGDTLELKTRLYDLSWEPVNKLELSLDIEE